MKKTAKPLPSFEELHRLFTLDYETGQLFWKPRPYADFDDEKKAVFWNKHFPGKAADFVNTEGYRRVWIRADGKSSEYYAHRLVWKMVNGHDPIPEVDHIDRNRSNNRPDNLRQATRSLNMENRSGYRRVGIYQTRSGEFRAQARVAGVIVRLGIFPCREDASRAMQLAASGA